MQRMSTVIPQSQRLDQGKKSPIIATGNPFSNRMTVSIPSGSSGALDKDLVGIKDPANFRKSLLGNDETSLYENFEK